MVFKSFNMENKIARNEKYGGYQSEDSLVRDFCFVLESSNSPWGQVGLTREFSYIRGRTDVVAVDYLGHIIAFEMKLEKWVQAMYQAYRNTCFAHCSYVVLPEPIALHAQRNCYEFTRRAIGICYIKNKTVIINLQAKHQTPIQPWLSRIAVEKTLDKKNGEF